MLRLIFKSLDWLGRQGTRAIAISLVLGMLLPPLSAVLKPLIPEAVFLLLLVAFLRVDAHAVWHRIRRPWLVVAVVGWIMVVLPLALGLPLLAIGAETWRPGVMTAFIVMAIAPPIMSTPGFTYLLNLDGALSLTVLIAAMVATPVLCPLIAGLLVGDALPISALDMGIRLAVLLSGSLIAALVLRRLIGLERIERSRRVFDGANVVLLFVFAVAIMDGVAVQLIEEPVFVLGLLAAAVGFSVTFIVISAFVFRLAGLEQALTIAISSGNRNMALMAAALAGAIPDASWTFFAVAQVPIYLLPWLTKPVVDRLIISPRAAGRH